MVAHNNNESQTCYSMQIFVKLITENRCVTLDVYPDTTVEEVKQQLYTKEGCSVERQRFIYAGKELLNWQTLEECNVIKGVQIFLVLRNNSLMKIYVKTLTSNKCITVDVFPSDTIREVKQKLLIKEPYPIDQYVFYYSDKELLDTCTLANYNVSSETILFLIQKPSTIKILVNTFPDNKCITLESNYFDTVEAVKLKLQENAGYPVDRQRLVYSCKELEDYYMLADYGVKDEAQFFLVLRT